MRLTGQRSKGVEGVNVRESVRQGHLDGTLGRREGIYRSSATQ